MPLDSVNPDRALEEAHVVRRSIETIMAAIHIAERRGGELVGI
jgi:hypothetical protein